MQVTLFPGPSLEKMGGAWLVSPLLHLWLLFSCVCLCRTNTKLSNAEVVRNALLCPKCKSGPLPVKGISEEGDWKDMSEPCQQCGYVPTEMELNELCDVSCLDTGCN